MLAVKTAVSRDVEWLLCSAALMEMNPVIPRVKHIFAISLSMRDLPLPGAPTNLIAIECVASGEISEIACWTDCRTCSFPTRAGLVRNAECGESFQIARLCARASENRLCEIDDAEAGLRCGSGSVMIVTKRNKSRSMVAAEYRALASRRNGCGEEHSMLFATEIPRHSKNTRPSE